MDFSIWIKELPISIDVFQIADDAPDKGVSLERWTFSLLLRFVPGVGKKEFDLIINSGEDRGSTEESDFSDNGADFILLIQSLYSYLRVMPLDEKLKKAEIRKDKLQCR